MSISIIKHKNINWIKYHKALVSLEAPHKNIDLSKTEAKKLIKKTKVHLIRWTSNWDCNKETDFWYVIKDEKEDIANYKSKIRYQIKKGISNCIVEKTDKSIIANECYDVYLSAFGRYKSSSTPMNKKQFHNHHYYDNEKGIEYWIVKSIKTNKIVAFAKNRIQGNMVNYSVMKFSQESMNKEYSGYALVFKMNEYYLDKYDYVSDGAKSISHETNIQDFLIKKFNFRKAYCNLNVVFSNKINFIIFIFYPFKFILNKMNNSIANKFKLLLKHKELSI